MILLIYMGVLFFCYGIYNLFCYFRMFPTAKAGRHLLKLYRKIVRLCDNIFMVQLAEKLVRKLDFEQKELSMISAVLIYNGVNYSAAVYLFSRLLIFAVGFYRCALDACDVCRDNPVYSSRLCFHAFTILAVYR